MTGLGRGRSLALTAVFFLASMALWEGAVRGLAIPPFILPAPSAVAVALWRGLASGLYLKHLWYTLTETLLASAVVGSALGFGLGTAVAMSRWVEYFLYPYIIVLQLLPKVAIAPLFVIWFGFGLMSKVLNAGADHLLPAARQHHRGRPSADEDRLSLCAPSGPARQMFDITSPSALPFIFAGLTWRCLRPRRDRRRVRRRDPGSACSSRA